MGVVRLGNFNPHASMIWNGRHAAAPNADDVGPASRPWGLPPVDICTLFLCLFYYVFFDVHGLSFVLVDLFCFL